MKTPPKEIIKRKHSLLFALSPSGNPKFTIEETIELMEEYAQQFQSKLQTKDEEIEHLKEFGKELDSTINTYWTQSKMDRNEIDDLKFQLQESKAQLIDFIEKGAITDKILKKVIIDKIKSQLSTKDKTQEK